MRPLNDPSSNFVPEVNVASTFVLPPVHWQVLPDSTVIV